MRKSSRSISLALIGSALLLGGCQPAAEESEWSEGEDVAQTNPNATLDGVATGNDQYHNQHHSGGMGRTASGIGGAIIGSQIGRSLGGGMSSRPSSGGGGGAPVGGGVSSSPSARGGFGSSAGHSVSS